MLIPVLVVVFYLPYKWTNFAAAACSRSASLTDWLDGWIARRYDLYSAFGAFLDPVADKLMVAVALFLIVQCHPTRGWRCGRRSSSGREIAVSALREWMAELGQRAKVDGGRGRQAQDHRADGRDECLLYLPGVSRVTSARRCRLHDRRLAAGRCGRC